MGGQRVLTELVMVSDQVKVQNMRVFMRQLVLDEIDAPSIEASSPELGCEATSPSKDLEKKWAPEVSKFMPRR